MSHESAQPTPAEAGSRPDTLSNEVLELKIDDLFQEVENLKRRVQRLESQSTLTGKSAPEGVDPTPRVVSNPDPR
jgi:hypothetical protein